MHAARFLLSLLLSALVFTANTQHRKLLIRSANVVDMISGNILQDIDVYIRDSVIADIGKQLHPSANTDIIDGKGRWLIPGLWDMHAHIWSNSPINEFRDQLYFPLLLANGVTGVRDMWNDRASVSLWRQKIKEGTIDGPRIYAAGPIVDGPKKIWRLSLAIESVDRVKPVIDSLHYLEQDDFLKIYSNIPRDTYFRIAEECRKQQFPFEGHVPWQVSVIEAARAGQASQEHMKGMVEAASDSAKWLDSLLAIYAKGQRPTDTSIDSWENFNRFLVRTYSPKVASTLATEMANYDSWICPTFIMERGYFYSDDPNTRDTSRFPLVSAALVKSWDSTVASYKTMMTPETERSQEKIIRLQMEILDSLYHHGVPILAGSDFENPYTYPGYSLQDELTLLVAAGMTNLDALRAATIGPARFMHIDASYGSITKGKIADILLLDANPLQDIHNTKRIAGLVLHGKWLSHQKLEESVEAVKVLNRQLDKRPELFKDL